MKPVLLQMTIAAMALCVALGSPVQPEPRKFVYQKDSPSVRRYPVFPDRHFELDPSHVVKLAAEKNKDLKNELFPEVTPTKKPGMTQPEEAADVDFLAESETSTDSWNPVDAELTTATSRFFTTSTPAPETTSTSTFSFDGASAPVEGGFTPSSFFFTPHQDPPTSVFGNEGESSSLPPSSVFGNEDPSRTSVFGSEDPSSRPSSSIFGNEDPSRTSVFGSEDPSSKPSSSIFGNEDPSRTSIFESEDPSSRPSDFDNGSPSSSSFFESELPSSQPEHSVFGSPSLQDEPQEVPTGPFRFFSDSVDGDNSVFPEGPVTHEVGDFSAREEDSHFGVFTEGPADSTDIPMTTDLPSNAFMEEVGETMADSTALPVEDFAEISENRTDSPLVEEAVTDSAWDPVTQEIYTTEEADVFL